MTLGSDLVAKARSVASRKNRKQTVVGPSRTSMNESSFHTPVVGEEVREKSSSSTVEKNVSDDDNFNSGDTIFDYYTCSKADRESFFERYSEEGVKVPTEVLYFSSSLTNFAIEKKASLLALPEPYYLRPPGPTERVCFPREGEIGIYMGFLESGLRFPLDDDLHMIFRHYQLPLCAYSPSAVRLMVAFLSLIRRIGIPFSISVFRKVFQLRFVGNSCWATLVTRAGYGMIRRIPKLDPAWRSSFLFVGVPSDFSLPRTWVNTEGFKDSKPPASEADSRSLKVFTNATLEEVDFEDLMSEASLVRAGLRPSAEDFQRLKGKTCQGPSFIVVEDDDDMGMMGSVLKVANQNLRISVKRSRPSEERVRYSSPPPTPGTMVHGREEMYHFSAQGSSFSFVPPFPMDSSYSYFNDG